MFERLADDITLLMVNHNIISNDDRESYIYGLELLLPKIAFYLTIITIAIVSKTILVSTLFILMYMELRRYTGGFHCKTAEMCLLFSTLIYLIMIFLYLFNQIEIKYGLMITSIISLIIISVFSPVENKNRPLDNEEQNKYRVKAIIIAIIILVVTIAAFLLKVNQIFFSASWALTADAALIILNLRRKNSEESNAENNCFNG